MQWILYLFVLNNPISTRRSVCCAALVDQPTQGKRLKKMLINYLTKAPTNPDRLDNRVPVLPPRIAAGHPAQVLARHTRCKIKGRSPPRASVAALARLPLRVRGATPAQCGACPRTWCREWQTWDWAQRTACHCPLASVAPRAPRDRLSGRPKGPDGRSPSDPRIPGSSSPCAHSIAANRSSRSSMIPASDPCAAERGGAGHARRKPKVEAKPCVCKKERASSLALVDRSKGARRRLWCSSAAGCSIIGAIASSRLE